MSDRRTKFYLDKQNAKFLGVCSGIADYTGVDATLIRIATVALVFFGSGFPILLYFIAAFIADPKPRSLRDESPEERKFWQGVRAKPGATVRDVRSSFRDIDRRLADVEMHVTSHNRRLADEIDALR